MGFSEHEDCFVWQCDKCGHSAVFPLDDFWGAVAELKARRWEFSRDGEDWYHTCQKCRRTAAQILDMPSNKISGGMR
jgi:hypothetical protein